MMMMVLMVIMVLMMMVVMMMVMSMKMIMTMAAMITAADGWIAVVLSLIAALHNRQAIPADVVAS